MPSTDTDILNYLLTLEHIQDALYRQGLQNSSQYEFQNAGFPDPFFDNLKKASAEESARVQRLGDTLSGIGAPVSAECIYTWPPIEGATGFVGVANIIAGLITSAYLGILDDITSPTISSALAVVARIQAGQSAYIRQSIHKDDNSSATDTPLTPDEVWTIAHTFIGSCPPSNPPLPVKAYPTLTVASDTPLPIKVGKNLVLSPRGGAINASGVMGAFLTSKEPVYFKVTSDGKDGWKGSVPEGVAGQSYVVLTEGKAGVEKGNVLAGPAILEVAG
ncbi:MAG: hypothetical protein Q9217_002117 [Psora testacea]